MALAAMGSSNEMQTFTASGDLFTRDLMQFSAGHFGKKYFNDLENGTSTWSDAAEFAEAATGMQMMGDIGADLIYKGFGVAKNVAGMFGGGVAEEMDGVAEFGFQQTGAGKFTGSADDAYDSVRANKSDVATISKNTGIKSENIAKIKNHLFYNEHLLDRYVDYGVPAVLKVFDSDIEIANSWARLESGNYTEEDMQLLRHETAEAWYMNKYNSGYTAAHNAADKKFPAPDMDNMKSAKKQFQR